MSYVLRMVWVSVAIFLIGIAVFVISTGNHALPSNCEIAKTFYKSKDGVSFEKFLENQFRVYGVIQSGGLFTDPKYSFSIYEQHKPIEHQYKMYDYLFSRAGLPHSRMALSISKEEWENGKKNSMWCCTSGTPKPDTANARDFPRKC